jgi:hypothetical protein
MKQETYTELEKIIVKGAKDDYLIFELMCGAIGFLLVFALFSTWGNVPAMLVIANGIIVFILAYLLTDLAMNARIEARKKLMVELKQDVV